MLAYSSVHILRSCDFYVISCLCFDANLNTVTDHFSSLASLWDY